MSPLNKKAKTVHSVHAKKETIVSDKIESLIIKLEKKFRTEISTENNQATLSPYGLEGQLLWQYVRFNKQYQIDYDMLEKMIENVISKYKDDEFEHIREMKVQRLDVMFQYRWNVLNSTDYNDKILGDEKKFLNQMTEKKVLNDDGTFIIETPFDECFFNLNATIQLDHETLQQQYTPSLLSKALLSIQRRKLKESNLNFLKHPVEPLVLSINPFFPREKIIQEVTKILDSKQYKEARDIEIKITKERRKLKNKRSKRDLLEYFVCYYYRKEQLLNYKEVTNKLYTLTGNRMSPRVDTIQDKINNFIKISNISPWYFLFQ